MSAIDGDMLAGLILAIIIGTILVICLFVIIFRMKSCAFCKHRRNNLLNSEIDNLTCVSRNVHFNANGHYIICNTSPSPLSDESIRTLSNNSQDSEIKINVNEELRSPLIQRSTPRSMQRGLMNRLAHQGEQTPPSANSLERRFTCDPGRIRRSRERIQNTDVLRVMHSTVPRSYRSLRNQPDMSYYYEESPPPYTFEPTPPPSYEMAVAETSNSLEDMHINTSFTCD